MYWNLPEEHNRILDQWLTLTWDVLKYHVQSCIIIIQIRLTLTWDVLKCYNIKYIIEQTVWLTLTWDVLK